MKHVNQGGYRFVTYGFAQTTRVYSPLSLHGQQKCTLHGQHVCTVHCLFTDNTRVLSTVFSQTTRVSSPLSFHGQHTCTLHCLCTRKRATVGKSQWFDISWGSQDLSAIQGYLAHKKTSSHASLQWTYAYGPPAVLGGGGVFLF